MKTPAATSLSLEDRILWNQVARTTTPLRGKVHSPLELDPEPEPAEKAAETLANWLGDTGVETAPKRQPPRSQAPVALDEPTRQKLAKGRLELEARVDLHGLTQSQAHGLLLSFLQRAHTAGVRHVLVITGKGSSFGSDGVLRRAVPDWFATPPFRPLVGSYESAARHHGGGGALYVRMRRQSPARG